MTGFAPIAGIGLAYYEIKKLLISESGKINWSSRAFNLVKGDDIFSRYAVLLVAQIPYLNRLAILFVAWQVVFFMRWTGSGDITLGEFVINTSEGPGNQVYGMIGRKQMVVIRTITRKWYVCSTN